MTRRQQVITTAWTTILAGVITYTLIGMARLECGEMDPCPTGGSMPYAGLMIVLAVVIAAIQAAFLAMIWRRAGD